MLNPERWQLAERIFHEAAELPAGQRAAFVESSCGGDEEVKKEVVSLLEADAQDSGVDESLAARIAAEWAAPARPIEGREVGGYRVTVLLGAGGMGETYLAEDTALGRRVALKFLPREFTRDARRVRRFIEEARAASALNHPGIVTVYGAGEFEGQRYIATEFIDGETVRERLANGPLPAAEALDIAIQTAAALSAAHEAGIIHRDVKPENIMIRRDGYVKIIDFGLARPAESGDVHPRQLTRAGEVLGTIDYMAPEQAAGGKVDARADIYSLAVMLYEMLTGELPRELGSASGSRGERKSKSSISPAALRVVRRGVASDPAKRYQSARELQRELEELRGSATWPRQWVDRRARWVSATALAVLVFGFGIYRSMGSRRSTSPVTSIVVMPLKALGGSDQAHLEQGMTEAIIARLSGLRQLRVPPAEAIRANEDPFDAARRLGVDAALTGSVQREGDRLRVTAQLSRASDRGQIWAEQYDETFTNIFAIQDAIAERVADSLVAELSTSDKAVLTRHETRNSEAYDLYLRAREQWALRTPNTIRTAIKMYQQAIAIEPQFALAYAGLADSYNLAVSGMAPLTRGPLARAAAEKALQLDPRSAEAHTAMAFLEYKFEWKWDEADREFRRAIELNPRYTLAHHWYGEFLKLLMRHDDSIREFRQAMELDPFSIPVHYDFILSLLNAGRVAEARTILNQTMALDPASPRVLFGEAAVLAGEGRRDESVEVELRAQLLAGDPEAGINQLRAAYRAGGDRALNEKRLELAIGNFKHGNYMAPFAATTLADVYARLQDRERTLFWLKKATDLHEDEPLVMMTHLFDFLRGDAEFVWLEKRVGFLR